MKKSLAEFIEELGWLCNDDFDIILKWASYNAVEPKLIAEIATLASAISDAAASYKWKVKEWAYYAYSNLVPEITEDTPDPILLNSIRLAYLAFNGKQFHTVCKRMLEARNVDIEIIKPLHPDIYAAYTEEGTKED